MRLTKKELKRLSKSQLIEIILKLHDQQDQYEKQLAVLNERIARLERTSQTSSKPPSTDNSNPKRNQSLRVKTGRKPGGQKGHVGRTRQQVETPDEIKACLPESHCEHCGGLLDRHQAVVLEKRQEVEIPAIKPRVIEYQKMGIHCSCGQCNRGCFPEHIKAAMQIGQQMKSFLIYLNVVQLIPYQRLTVLARDLFNFELCKGSIENSLEDATQKATPIYHGIMGLIKRSKWVGADETGKRVEGKRWWEWVWQNDRASYYAIDESRGYQVVQKHFGEDYDGSLCHDCWSAHNNTIAKSGHQQCLPHIQRDLQFLIETYKSRWAYEFNLFLKSAQKARDQIWLDGFDEHLRTVVIQQYREKLSPFLVRNGPNNDVLKLQKRVIKHQKSILHFMTDPDIPFHNNSSERAIRMAKVKQKISGGFRSQRGAERQSILLSIIETAKKQNMNLLSAIQKLLNNSLTFQGC